MVLYIECTSVTMHDDITVHVIYQTSNSMYKYQPTYFMMYMMTMTHTSTSLDILTFITTAFVSTYLLTRRHSNTSSNNNGTTTKYQVVFVLGGPGAGKGTQCERLIQETNYNLNWSHLSAGDLLRAERKKQGSELAGLINECISAGRIVPAEITAQLLKNAMDDISKASSGTRRKFLIDGFPRSEGNVLAWEKLLGNGIAQVEFVLFLDCPEDVMTGRLLERGLTSGRNDDNLEVVRKRFVTFRKESMPIVDMYEKQGKLRRVVADRSVDTVYMDVLDLFKDL